MATVGTILFTILALLAYTGDDEAKVKPIYDIDFKYLFHNREFMYSKDAYSASGTFNGMLLTPSVGLDYNTGNIEHNFRLGYEFLYNCGEHNYRQIPQEPIAYYKATRRTDLDEMSITAGIFPRSFISEEYSEAVWSDSLKVYDRQIEGLLLNYRSEFFRAELGCDWMELYGDNHRERFNIFTSGYMSLLNAPSADGRSVFDLSLDWEVNYFHYANYYYTPGEIVTPGVADNGFINPYVKAYYNTEKLNARAYITAGAMIGYQWERRQQEKASMPLGFQSVALIRIKNFHVKNTLYVGQDQQPLYRLRDMDGNKYCNNLYFSQAFYRASFFDKIETAWDKQIGKYLTLSLGADVYFLEQGFAGWVQTFGLKFDFCNAR